MTGRFLGARRDFLRASALSTAGLLLPEQFSAFSQTAPTLGGASDQALQLDRSYSREQLVSLYWKGDQPSRGLVASPKASMLYFWDSSAKQLVNPLNVKVDSSIKPATYSLEVEVFNFHTSSTDLGTIWKGATNNAQLTFNVKTPGEDDDISWIVSMGLQFASNFLGGADKKSFGLTDNNTPTKEFRKSERVIITDGGGEIQTFVAAQKKKSIWDNLLQIVKAFAESPVLGILPIPKLLPEAVKTLSGTFDYIQSKEQLIPVLGGLKQRFRLYDGAPAASVPDGVLVLRPGFWVVLDADFAQQHWDANRNLPDLVLDLYGQLYELRDKSEKPVDTTYCVSTLSFPTVKTAS
jgi:hypothetical protein